jgi:hypothetical protein
MDEPIDRASRQAERRAFLFDDPDSLRAGVWEALRAVEAVLPQLPRRLEPKRKAGRAAS